MRKMVINDCGEGLSKRAVVIELAALHYIDWEPQGFQMLASAFHCARCLNGATTTCWYFRCVGRSFGRCQGVWEYHLDY